MLAAASYSYIGLADLVPGLHIRHEAVNGAGPFAMVLAGTVTIRMLTVLQKSEVSMRASVDIFIIEQAVNLLSQQAWCWGRDILRAEGNWLIDIGFDRIEPPANRKHCSSLYTLALPHRGCVVLRGFGVFYGDSQWGGIFLPRYEFRPRYTTHATLACPPWSKADLPEFNPPTEPQQHACAMLTLGLIDWIQS